MASQKYNILYGRLSQEDERQRDDRQKESNSIHHFYNLLPGRTVKVCTGVAIVRQEQRVFKSMIRCVLFQEEFLVVDGVGFFLPVIPLCSRWMPQQHPRTSCSHSLIQI